MRLCCKNFSICTNDKLFEHTIVRREISSEEDVAENLSGVKACCCDEFVGGYVLR